MPSSDRTIPKKRKTPAATSSIISYRLSEEQVRRLRGVAAAEGLKLGDYARELVLKKLDEGEIDRREVEALRDDFRKLTLEFSAFRTAFALAVEALLVSSSSQEPVSLADAKFWVDDKIRSRFTAAKASP
jgi:hypothetical protein